MQIRPISPSFKGYVEAKCKENLVGSWKDALPVTFNTNSISYSPRPYCSDPLADYNRTEIKCGSDTYIADCPYDTFQKACLKSDSPEMKGKLVKIIFKTISY